MSPQVKERYRAYINGRIGSSCINRHHEKCRGQGRTSACECHCHKEPKK